MLLAGLALLPILSGGCFSAGDRMQLLAQRSRWLTSTLQGSTYRHQIFASRPAVTETSAGVLYIFIEGDGSPWSVDGQRPSQDPTAIRPLALELAARTPHSILYLGRPCYMSARSDPACTPDVWTSQRYSEAVVASMAVVANRFIATGGFRNAALIGYSGGGTLAVLLAPRVPAARAVVTIAGNLDVSAWTQLHHYLPLSGSLDPASMPALDPRIAQRHLTGGRDANVPQSVAERYLSARDPSEIWHYPRFDHVCCWVQQWPQILRRIDRVVSDSLHADNAQLENQGEHHEPIRSGRIDPDRGAWIAGRADQR